MNYTEMIKLITSGEWRNIETNEICSFSWSEPDQSINISIKTGTRAGKSDSHKFVKLYLSKEEQENCKVLRFQSNLLTSRFSMESESSPLFVDSKIFGEMVLERIKS